MYCTRCGATIPEGAAFCPNCGAAAPTAGAVATSSVSVPMPPSGAWSAATPIVYAGFWRRFWAYLIDWILLAAVTTPITVLLGLPMFGRFGSTADMAPEEMAAMIGSIFLSNTISILGNWMYFALMESSGRQATLGKMALGIKVTDLEGRRISFARASGRYFAAILSAIILCIGFLMIAFTEKKQGLHDMLAGTLVVRS
jgi:uncharacterized RDD family membrane protein YckC